MSLRNWALGLLGGAIGAPAAIWLGYILSPATFSERPAVSTQPPSLAPSTSQPAAPAADAQREPFLQHRDALESRARDALGTSLVVDMVRGITSVTLQQDGKDYIISMHVAHTIAVWLNPIQPSVKDIFVVKTAERGKSIDIRGLRSSRGEAEVLTIGQRAIIEMNDGKRLQLILTGVQWYRAGDNKDEARFKYKFYDPSEFLIDAL